MKSTIDWVSFGEVTVFVVLVGLVAVALAFVGAAVWAQRSRRIMWERYLQERAVRSELENPRIVSVSPPEPPPPPTRIVKW